MKRYKWIILITCILYIKGIVLTLLISSNNGYSFAEIEIEKNLIIAHLAMLLVLVLPCLIFKDKGSIKYLIFIDIIYSIFIILDLWVYRGTGHLLEMKFLFFSEGFITLNKGIINPSIKDVVFIPDIVVLIFLCKKSVMKYKYERRLGLSLSFIAISLIIVGTCHYIFDIKKDSNISVRFFQEEWEASWNPATRILYRSPIGHHIYEDYKTILKVIKKTDENEIKEIEEWLEWNNENLEDNEYKAIAKGKNVVFLQIESLENFVTNNKVYDQEITPNLNKIIKEGLYFKNIHEQNNAGNSIDMDMMAASGVLPLGDVITYLEYPEVQYNSLPRLLNNEGYNTILTHAERAGDWNWAEAGKSAAGYKTLWDINEYTIDEYAGFGLSDRSLYTQIVAKLAKEEGPFLAVVPTLTSHGPFDIDEKYRELNLPKDLDENRLGGYFQSIYYADKQIGLFFELLEENKLLENTIVVIYGDHGGIHKYYMEDVEASNIEGDWWQEKDNKVPLIIYGRDLPNKVIDTFGGQIDIMPTVSYILGLDTKGCEMGRNLLNTNRNATVIKDGIVVGKPKEEEKKMLEKAYDISDKIIKNNYYFSTNRIE